MRPAGKLHLQVISLYLFCTTMFIILQNSTSLRPFIRMPILFHLLFHSMNAMDTS